VAGSYELDNETWDPIKCREFLY